MKRPRNLNNMSQEQTAQGYQASALVEFRFGKKSDQAPTGLSLSVKDIEPTRMPSPPPSPSGSRDNPTRGPLMGRSFSDKSANSVPGRARRKKTMKRASTTGTLPITSSLRIETMTSIKTDTDFDHLDKIEESIPMPNISEESKKSDESSDNNSDYTMNLPTVSSAKGKDQKHRFSSVTLNPMAQVVQ